MKDLDLYWATQPVTLKLTHMDLNFDLNYIPTSKRCQVSAQPLAEKRQV